MTKRGHLVIFIITYVALVVASGIRFVTHVWQPAPASQDAPADASTSK